MMESERRVSRSASARPFAPTTTGAVSISDVCPTSRGLSRVAVDLALGDIDQQAAAHQLVNRRGASSGSHIGPQLLQTRGTTQGGVDPTGRSRSLGGHQGLRAARQVRVVGRFETLQSVGSATHDDIVFLERRARALEGTYSRKQGQWRGSETN